MSYRPGNKSSDRAKSFKKLQGDDEARRKRGEHLVEIRKTKRSEELQKKRREGEPEQTGETLGAFGGPTDLATSAQAKVRAAHPIIA
jgi:hypothetical protein